MKRFVDMRPADACGYRFAFWDTIVSQFECFNGSSAWDSLPEFLTDCAHDRVLISKTDRLVALMPDWTRTPCAPNDYTEYEVVRVKG